jgi:ketosteroid isomerase-like protein
MGQNADTIKAAYEAFGQGDLDGAAEAWADDIRWQEPADERLPLHGMIEGRDNVKQALMGLFAHWDSFAVIPDEFHDSDETVIVIGRLEAKAKESGSEVKIPFVHVWRMRDGKAGDGLLVTDTLEEAKALGFAG